MQADEPGSGSPGAHSREASPRPSLFPSLPSASPTPGEQGGRSGEPPQRWGLFGKFCFLGLTGL